MAANNNLELIPESLCRCGQVGRATALNPRTTDTHPVAFGMQNGPFPLALWMETTRAVPAIPSLGLQHPLGDTGSMRPEGTVHTCVGSGSERSLRQRAEDPQQLAN